MDTTRNWKRRSLAAVAVLGLAAALTVACADPDAGPAPTGGDNGAGQAPDDEVTLEVLGPADGDTVTLPFEVSVDSDVELGPVADEVHHLHIWFGDDPTDQEGFELYESDTAMVERAPDGEQTMWVQIHTFDHQPASDPVSVSVTISGGGDPGGDDEEDGGGPYDY